MVDKNRSLLKGRRIVSAASSWAVLDGYSLRTLRCRDASELETRDLRRTARDLPFGGRLRVVASILNVTFDCHDARRVAAFWGAVTGYSLEERHDPGNHYWVASPPDDGRPRLVFVTVPERKVLKNRVHLDMVPSARARCPVRC
jgi:Glyoxalase-like domain